MLCYHGFTGSSGVRTLKKWDKTCTTSSNEIRYSHWIHCDSASLRRFLIGMFILLTMMAFLIALMTNFPYCLSFKSFEGKSSSLAFVKANTARYLPSGSSKTHHRDLNNANRARYLSSGSGIPDFSQEPVEPFRYWWFDVIHFNAAGFNCLHYMMNYSTRLYH